MCGIIKIYKKKKDVLTVKLLNVQMYVISKAIESKYSWYSYLVGIWRSPQATFGLRDQGLKF